MKKLYDEIMALKITSINEYNDEFNNGLDAAAELAKKYDDEIDVLRTEVNKLNILLRCDNK